MASKSKTAKGAKKAPAPKPRKPAPKPKAIVKTKPSAAKKPAKAVARKPAPKPKAAKPAEKKAPASKPKASPKKPLKAPAKPKPVAKKIATKPVKAAVSVKAPPASKPKSVKSAPVAKKPVPQAKVVAKPAKVPAAPLPRKADPAPDKKAGKGKPKIDLFKAAFFQEVVVGSPSTRKVRAVAAPVSSSARKQPKGEESHDELIARIEKELLTVRMTGKKVQREQVCTKCCINPVDPSYMVDRDTGYCTECAIVLGLGHTREARQQNFHPSLMKSEDGDGDGAE